MGLYGAKDIEARFRAVSKPPVPFRLRFVSQAAISPATRTIGSQNTKISLTLRTQSQDMALRPQSLSPWAKQAEAAH